MQRTPTPKGEEMSSLNPSPSKQSSSQQHQQQRKNKTSAFENRSSNPSEHVYYQRYGSTTVFDFSSPVTDEEYDAGASHNIDHHLHNLRHHRRGGPIARLFDKFSLSPEFRRYVIVGTIIWFLLLIPAVWMDVERIACPITINTTHGTAVPPSDNDYSVASNKFGSSSVKSTVTTLFNHTVHESSFAISSSSLIGDSSGGKDYTFNASNSLVFCKQSSDPDPLRWASGVALLVSLIAMLIAVLFSEGAAANFCNYENHAQLFGVLPLVVLRTLMISGVITAYSIQVWFLVILKRPSCPETNHPCALYRLQEAALTLGMVSGAYIVFFMVSCLLLTFGVDNKLTPGLVKTILLAGNDPDVDSNSGLLEPASPHFVEFHFELHRKCCPCDCCETNCCCGRSSGLFFNLAKCLDRIRISWHQFYHDDDRCPPPLQCCNMAFCCDLDDHAPRQPFKTTYKNAFLSAFFGSLSPALGYYLIISTILLIIKNTESTSKWQLEPPPDSYFSCHDLFPATQELPTILSGEDHAIYRLNALSNAEVLICSNLSDFDPLIKNLPGILRTPNYMTSDFPACSYFDVQERCVGQYCNQAFASPPRPFGVFWSYEFNTKSSSRACAFEPLPRNFYPNCSQTNIIRLSGLGESLIGKSFLLPPLCLAIGMRFAAPLFAAVFIFIRCRWYRSKESQKEFMRLYGRHKKHYLESFACDCLCTNFIVAFMDPERFTELPYPPRYRMAMVSVQVCEFLIWIFRVQPCWRWFQVVFVCAQGLVLMKSIYNLYRDEIMIARREMHVERRKVKGEVVESETEQD